MYLGTDFSECLQSTCAKVLFADVRKRILNSAFIYKMHQGSDFREFWAGYRQHDDRDWGGRDSYRERDRDRGGVRERDRDDDYRCVCVCVYVCMLEVHIHWIDLWALGSCVQRTQAHTHARARTHARTHTRIYVSLLGNRRRREYDDRGGGGYQKSPPVEPNRTLVIRGLSLSHTHTHSLSLSLSRARAHAKRRETVYRHGFAIRKCMYVNVCM